MSHPARAEGVVNMITTDNLYPSIKCLFWKHTKFSISNELSIETHTNYIYEREREREQNKHFTLF